MNAPTFAMREKAKLHPVIRDVLLSGATSVVVSAASLLVVSLVGRLAGPKEIAEYLLVRRVSSWILSGILLGIGMALPRYVAHVTGRPALQKSYFSAGLVLALGPTVLLALIISLRARLFGSLLFGDSRFRTLILPLALVLIANAFHATVFGFYRGRLEMERANGLQFLNFAVFPLLSVLALWIRGSIAGLFGILALLTAASSAMMAIPIFREKGETRTRWRAISGELLRYGTSRIPGDLGLLGMFTVAPIIAAHYLSLPKLAPMLLGLGVLNVLGTSANPLNQVLLSKVTMMLAEGRRHQAETYIRYLLAGAIEMSVFVCLQAVIFADVAIRIWVGPKYLNDMVLIRILLAAIPFYLLYTALRCVIDAASVTAYNTRNIFFGLAIFVAVLLVEVRTVPSSWMLISIATAFLVALVVLAWFTVGTIKQLYDVSFSWRASLPALAFCAILALVGLLFRRVEHFQTGSLEFISLEFFLTLSFLAFLRRQRSPWLMFLQDAFLQRRTEVECPSDLVVLKSA